METLKDLLIPALDEFRREEGLPGGPATSDTPLFGKNATFDSLKLVSYIVLVEEKLEAATGHSIRIVSEKAMSRKSSPFRTLGTLAEYVDELLVEAKAV